MPFLVAYTCMPLLSTVWSLISTATTSSLSSSELWVFRMHTGQGSLPSFSAAVFVYSSGLRILLHLGSEW